MSLDSALAENSRTTHPIVSKREILCVFTEKDRTAQFFDETDIAKSASYRETPMTETETRLAEGDALDGQTPSHETASAESSLAEAQETVEEFMAVAAQQNAAASEAVPERRHHPGPYIAFEHVSKAFGDLVVLDDVSFSVLPGETLCILGRSGVGKSVALKILMGFLQSDQGRVMIAGEDISGFSEQKLQVVRRKVTMVFQNGALFDSLTVGENVAFPLRERGDLAEDQIQQIVRGMLEMVGVAGMEDLLPSDLSTGMKRSVAIARALASQPEAILYDEPTTMVDPLMAHLLGELIERLKTQLHLTSIVVTHDMRFARKLADRIVFLHQGEARFFGSVEEMDRSDDPVLKEFLIMDELVLPL
jgi:phospholipid/cholesterol/gamma-HCH transport system ATP-binding protein